MSLLEAACRSCGSSPLEQVLSLGRTPLANSLLREEDLDKPEPTYPLELAFCARCGLVQITETVPPEILFRDYIYFSSFSDTMLRHASELVGRVVKERRLGPQSLAMEVASNDGYLLQYYKRAGIPVLGIEPARNVASVAVKERGIPTISEFFGPDLARKLVREGRRAHVLHANNVLAHVADLNGFVEGMRDVLHPEGIALVEVPYLGEMIAGCEFDTIYHEHLCYFSLTALDRLFRRHGLRPVDVEKIPLHGGSLLVTVALEGSSDSPAAAVVAMLARERQTGLDRPEYYATYSRRVEALRDDLRAQLWRVKATGKRIAAYGASAKGSTLLNYTRIGQETLDFVVDRSTYKQGLYMPGVHLPILPPSRLLEAMPDFVFLLTWNFAEEIMDQQAEYRRRGGRFIVPIPEVSFV